MVSILLESYYAGAYWGIREEKVRSCAARASALFRQLAACDSVFHRWFELGRSRQGALKHEILADSETIQALLLRGRNRTDFGRQVISELGYSLYVWNGGSDDRDATSLNFNCGCYSSQLGINRCMLLLPAGEETRARALQIPTLIDILSCMVTSWEASWGVVDTSDHTQIAPRKEPTDPIVGWITYLSAARSS